MCKHLDLRFGSGNKSLGFGFRVQTPELGGFRVEVPEEGCSMVHSIEVLKNWGLGLVFTVQG